MEKLRILGIPWECADVTTDDKEDQAPTLEEKKNFAHNIYKVKSEELGEVVTKLDQCCPSALDKVRPRRSPSLRFSFLNLACMSCGAEIETRQGRNRNQH